MSKRLLTVYERADCHLCEDLLLALAPHQERLGFDLERVDVDLDPRLRIRWGRKIPVLVEGEREICHYFLDETALARHFEAPPLPRRDGEGT